MIVFEKVTVSIGRNRIVETLDLTIERGQLAVLLGPSGVGKTTVLRLAAGLLAPSVGVVRNLGLATAMVFQSPHLLPWENALDNAGLALAAKGIGRRQARDEARQWLRRLGFHEDDLGKRPAELSGGMCSRVAIARAFIAAPDVVLLDEPFAALDPARRRGLQGLLRDLVEEVGVTALFVTHDPVEAVRLADRILVLTGTPGRIALDLPRSPVADPAAIWQSVAELARLPEMAGVWAKSEESESRNRT